MYTIEKYISDNILLAKSIVIKISDIPIQINNSLKLKYGIDIPSDKHQWKYFLNLAGMKHFTNNDVYVTVLETNTLELLTKELLDEYTDTKKLLLEKGSSYLDLVLKYPNDIGYIDGCINPVDLEYAINAEDGTILAYNKFLIEDQELYLINAINDYIKLFLDRWYLREYNITDELYLTSLLSVLYSTLPNKIMNIRLSKVFTNEANMFHLEHYFRSNFNLWENVQVLNKKSLWWLYNNLEYLKKHVGKENTLEIILDKIFQANNVGAGKLVLGFKESYLKTNPNLKESIFVPSEPEIVSIPLNDSYILDENTSRSTESLIMSQLTADTVDSNQYGDDDFYIDVFKNKIANKNILLEDTKTLDINSIKLLDVYGLNFLETVMDNWIYKATTNKYNLIKYFTDPNTKASYTLSPKQGFLYLLKMISLLYSTEDNPVIDKYYYNNVVHNSYDKDRLIDNLFTKDDLGEIVDVILDKLPVIDYISNEKKYRSFILETLGLFQLVRVIDSNIETLSLSTDIKAVANRILDRGVIELGPEGTRIDDLLLENGLVIEFIELYDPVRTITELLTVFTEIDIDIYKQFIDFNNNFISIFNKLTSYTTQMIYSSDDAKSLYSKYTAVGVNHVSKGVIRVENASMVPLELNKTHIATLANNFTDRLDGFYIDNDNNITLCETKMDGLAYSYVQHNEIIGEVTTPRVYLEVYNDCIPYYIPNINANANTFEDSDTKGKTKDHDVINTLSEYVIDPVVAYTTDNTSDEPTGSTTEPNLIGEIEI